jgi:hypothetical protein
MGDNKETGELSDMQKTLLKRQQDEEESKSLALDLETLNTEYKNLLVRYKQAVLDYTDFLNEEAAKPCLQFQPNSRGISQKCYEEIWKKSGCTTTGVVGANSEWAKARTLNELIYDSFLWATLTNENHRRGCYGTYEAPYLIIGVGTNGRLYVRNGLEGFWNIINDDAASDLASICTGNDGKSVIASARSSRMFSKPTYDHPNWQPVRNEPCCVISVAMGPDGTLVGVGTDHKLWSKPNLEGRWTQTANPGEWISSICIAPDNSIFCVGGGNKIWKKNSYLNLPNQNWEYMGDNTCCVKAITIAPDGTFIGIGMSNRLWTKDSYKNLSTNWKGPYENSCCVIGITTIVNPKFSETNTKYSTATEPNYNINAKKFTEIKGQAFWGLRPLSVINNGTLQDCNASCAKTPGCSGATYNNTDHGRAICWLSSGDASSIPALQNDYAIIPMRQQLLKIVEGVSEQLKNVNSKMQTKINRIREIYGDQIQERDIQNHNLIGQHSNLEVERKKIHNMLTKYTNLENQESEVDLFVTQNYYWFYLLSALVLIFIIILFYSSADANTAKAISSTASSFVITPISMIKEQTKIVNPYYLLFAFILFFTITYTYNQYYQRIYNNLPTARNLFSETNILYFFIGLLIIVGIGSRFTK